MQITNTKDITTQHVKILVHGPSGSGKTRLCGTTGGNPIILSAEAGLLSLRGQDIDVIEIKSLDDLRAAYSFLATDNVYDWVCLDSISEIAEQVLSFEKSNTKDGRMAYGEMNEKVIALVKSFRDLPKNVYICAKQGQIKDEVTGGVIVGADAPGKTIGPALPYLFDIVLALHVWKTPDGKIERALQTQRDGQYDAKDRSGALDFIERPDLNFIYNKIMNLTNQPKE